MWHDTAVSVTRSAITSGIFGMLATCTGSSAAIFTMRSTMSTVGRCVIGDDSTRSTRAIATSTTMPIITPIRTIFESIIRATTVAQPIITSTATRTFTRTPDRITTPRRIFTRPTITSWRTILPSIAPTSTAARTTPSTSARQQSHESADRRACFARLVHMYGQPAPSVGGAE